MDYSEEKEEVIDTNAYRPSYFTPPTIKGKIAENRINGKKKRERVIIYTQRAEKGEPIFGEGERETPEERKLHKNTERIKTRLFCKKKSALAIKKRDIK